MVGMAKPVEVSSSGASVVLGVSHTAAAIRYSEAGQASALKKKPTWVATMPGEQRGDVAGCVPHAGGGDQIPARALARREQPGRDGDQHEQQQVSERIDHVDGGARGVSAAGVDDGVEGKGGEQRAGEQAGDDAVEVVGEREAAHVAAHEHHDADVGEREEAIPEHVGYRQRRRRGAVQRLDGHREVARRPGRHPDAQPQTEGSVALVASVRGARRAGCTAISKPATPHAVDERRRRAVVA